MKYFFLLPLLFLNLTGCMSSTKLWLNEQKSLPPKKIQNIFVFLGPPRIPSQPLALLAATRKSANSVWAIEVLKAEAAELGADAIVNINMHYIPGILPELRVEGLAVKYEK